jgi:hypothetical protein
MNRVWNLKFASEDLERFLIHESASEAVELLDRDQMLTRFLTRFPRHKPFHDELAKIVAKYPPMFLVGRVHAMNV